ncbi:MAG: hypothetical protein FWC97_08220 [Treponema sp.]|nr:hypothetical protein [Treponema sp.]
MATPLEIRERHKNHLRSLLNIKGANQDKSVSKLDEEIKVAIAPMEQEDIAWVEKITGTKAI